MKRTLLKIATACTLVLASTACWTLPAADEWRALPHGLVFDGPEIVHTRAGVVARVPGAYAGWLGDLTTDDSLLLRALIAALTGRCPAVAQLTMAVAIENGSDRTVWLYPGRGCLLIGDREVDLRDCLLWSVGSAAELAPGEEARMALIFGLPSVPPGELRELRYVFDGPVDEGGQALSGKDYEFEIALEPYSGE